MKTTSEEQENGDEELEVLVKETYNKIKDVHGGNIITENLTFSELKYVFERVINFIDFAKFEFGEDITN